MPQTFFPAATPAHPVSVDGMTLTPFFTMAAPAEGIEQVVETALRGATYVRVIAMLMTGFHSWATFYKYVVNGEAPVT